MAATSESNLKLALAIGHEFVKTYYQALHEHAEDADKLVKLYMHDAVMVHGEEADTIKPVHSADQIKQVIKDLGFWKPRTEVSHLDAQMTIDRGVVLHVLGWLSANSTQLPATKRKFTQVFVLKHVGQQGYAIQNDMFRYLKEEDEPAPTVPAAHPAAKEQVMNGHVAAPAAPTVEAAPAAEQAAPAAKPAKAQEAKPAKETKPAKAQEAKPPKETKPAKAQADSTPKSAKPQAETAKSAKPQAAKAPASEPAKTQAAPEPKAPAATLSWAGRAAAQPAQSTTAAAPAAAARRAAPAAKTAPAAAPAAAQPAAPADAATPAADAADEATDGDRTRAPRSGGRKPSTKAEEAPLSHGIYIPNVPESGTQELKLENVTLVVQERKERRSDPRGRSGVFSVPPLLCPNQLNEILVSGNGFQYPVGGCQCMLTATTITLLAATTTAVTEIDDEK
ncbi:uncharacterized protein MONBRDRAFT_38647 [Monosiga brevicollis MX1]|uniref:NTF2 domain-containing protein n=1 Tax=Monosiga brevicollis TaxID=81824 RepID=A9V971_MONBE|nr:uncharacterized protein MONBRDRAFT_38647 [Monosiga brevicollis MX1]EDQ85879.1 predicted protein [Monosiga brevicollis MX1]|eukprot:XP_001749358.1 hypothetical protein [Monosiga brevicollis MX1]